MVKAIYQGHVKPQMAIKHFFSVSLPKSAVGNGQPSMFLPTALCLLPTDQYFKQLML